MEKIGRNIVVDAKQVEDAIQRSLRKKARDNARLRNATNAIGNPKEQESGSQDTPNGLEELRKIIEGETRDELLQREADIRRVLPNLRRSNASLQGSIRSGRETLGTSRQTMTESSILRQEIRMDAQAQRIRQYIWELEVIDDKLK